MKTRNIIVHPANEKEMNITKAFFKALKIKFEVSKEVFYNPEFIAKIQESRQQAKDGEVTRVEKKDLPQFFGLE